MKERYPLNAAGPFYVENGMCICCDAPLLEAPELIVYSEESHCYFKRQPSNPAELGRAIQAMHVS